VFSRVAVLFPGTSWCSTVPATPNVGVSLKRGSVRAFWHRPILYFLEVNTVWVQTECLRCARDSAPFSFSSQGGFGRPDGVLFPTSFVTRALFPPFGSLGRSLVFLSASDSLVSQNGPSTPGDRVPSGSKVRDGQRPRVLLMLFPRSSQPQDRGPRGANFPLTGAGD